MEKFAKGDRACSRRDGAQHPNRLTTAFSKAVHVKERVHGAGGSGQISSASLQLVAKSEISSKALNPTDRQKSPSSFLLQKDVL